MIIAPYASSKTSPILAFREKQANKKILQIKTLQNRISFPMGLCTPTPTAWHARVDGGAQPSRGDHQTRRRSPASPTSLCAAFRVSGSLDLPTAQRYELCAQGVKVLLVPLVNPYLLPLLLLISYFSGC